MKNTTHHQNKIIALYILLITGITLTFYANTNTLIIGNNLISINTIIGSIISILAIAGIHIMTKKRNTKKYNPNLRKFTLITLSAVFIIIAFNAAVKHKIQNTIHTQTHHSKLGEIKKITLYAHKPEETFYTNAEINGTNVKFLIDTGASYISLTWEDAQKIGINPNTLNFNIKTQTANGKAQAAITTLKKITLNTITIHDVKALVKPKNTQKISLLGMNALKKIHEIRIKGDTITFIDKIS